MNFDYTITIEGAATAVGIVGAAIGYLINLIKNWHNEYRNKRYRGTKLLILDLLEQHMWTGLSEQEIWRLYSDAANDEKRKKYKAWKPSKFKDYEFDKELKQLQLDFLVDLAGRDHYRIRVNPISTYDLERAAQAETMKFVSTNFTRERLLQVAKRILSTSPNKYERRGALELLIALGDPEAKQELNKALDSDDSELALEATKTLAQYLIATK